jgi:hypothetical protein
MEALSHPLIVTTYAVLLPSAIAAVIGLFRRLGKVEAKTERLDEIVREMRDDVRDQGKVLLVAMTDFRLHMQQEGENMDRLESLITELKGSSDAVR